MTPPTTTAHLSGVSRRYGAVQALHPLDLTLGHGVTGLLGPNGAGKSTLIRLLASAETPTTGELTVAGHPLTGSLAERTAARRVLGYLPQEVGFPRRMSAFAFLDYVAVLKEWSDTAARHAEVRRTLRLVGLEDLGTRRVSALSGGQRRRLALAQAFMGDPQLIILDEPTTGLDPEQRASLRNLVSEQARDKAVLLATHQTEDVSTLCDRVLVLDGGRIRFDGTVEELVATATGRVWVGEVANSGALVTWRTGTGAVRSVGGTPGPASRPVEPAVEDAYLLLRSAPTTREGVTS